MRALPSWFERWQAALSGLSWRERFLTTLALTALCHASLDLWLLAPSKRQLDALEQTLQARRLELDQLAAAAIRSSPDPAAPARAAPAPDRLALELEQFARELHRSSAPVHWNTELQRLLQRHPDVRLLHLKTKPPMPIFSSAELATLLADGAEHPALLSESAEFSVQGSYPALQALLAELERIAPAAYWSEARLEAHPPESTLTLVVRQIVPARAQPR